MIKTHSDDPDIVLAASHAHSIIKDILNKLPVATSYDYGGHQLKIGEYNVCTFCTSAIAEAQQAKNALQQISDNQEDSTIKEHLDLAAELFDAEAKAAILRAELHNGHGTENILNVILRFNYDRNINDSYQHSHHQGK